MLRRQKEKKEKEKDQERHDHDCYFTAQGEKSGFRFDERVLKQAGH
jgi:hypothetical protein